MTRPPQLWHKSPLGIRAHVPTRREFVPGPYAAYVDLSHRETEAIPSPLPTWCYFWPLTGGAVRESIKLFSSLVGLNVAEWDSVRSSSPTLTPVEFSKTR